MISGKTFFTVCNSRMSFNRGTDVRRTLLYLEISCDCQLPWATMCKKGYSTEAFYKFATRLTLVSTVKLTGPRKTGYPIQFSEVKCPFPMKNAVYTRYDEVSTRGNWNWNWRQRSGNKLSKRLLTSNLMVPSTKTSYTFIMHKRK